MSRRLLITLVLMVIGFGLILASLVVSCDHQLHHRRALLPSAPA